jgi:hypothetical protein
MNAVRGMGSLLLQVGLRKTRPSVASLAMSAVGLALVGVVGVLVAREARRGGRNAVASTRRSDAPAQSESGNDGVLAADAGSERCATCAGEVPIAPTEARLE